MNINIILAGVGGQGILSIATIIGNTAVKQGLYLKQAEVHGMSQRGGDVQSHLRLSDKEIAADLNWLIEQRDSGRFISVADYRLKVKGEAAKHIQFMDENAVTLEVSALQYFP